jgi:chromosome segregation ATPase
MSAHLNSQRSAVTEKDALLAERDQRIVERDQRIAELAQSQQTADEEKRSIRNQIAGLEEELKEEKECTVNLSEIANERREQVTDLSEKLDEAQERYEEAKWRLEVAGRFERLVVKRRKLIDSLLAGIRAKQKSNTALKAGLDGLRKFKAKSEQQQQKLLLRIDELSNKLKETEQQFANGQMSKKADDKLKKSEDTISALEERLNAQVQIIENLESDLSAAKAARQTTENQSKELTELKATLETRNETISRLEAELDEQQKQLGRLRGSESETMRLKAVKQQDQSMIDELQSQIDSLTAELAQQQKMAAGGAQDAAAASGAEIRKRDSQISDLKRSIKDQEKEITRLNEAVAGWQKKYEFLTTEPPSAYQSAAAEK